jgi:hypothetical protein
MMYNKVVTTVSLASVIYRQIVNIAYDRHCEIMYGDTLYACDALETHRCSVPALMT